MKILLFGSNGQVGHELSRSLASLGQVTELTRTPKNGLCGDLTDLEGIVSSLEKTRPHIIVNAAAYTAVDKAESDNARAQLINAEAPGMMAQQAKKLGALLIHYSTDYVFDGSDGRPWREIDEPHPLNFYGKTKLAGDLAIQSSGCRHLIFRSSWIYAREGQNFISTILRLARERDDLRIIEDQVGSPTGADLIADITTQAIRTIIDSPALDGLYHLAADGETSWCGYARFILEYALSKDIVLKADHVTPIPSMEYKTAAQRPLNSRLDTSKLRQALGITFPIWQTGVAHALDYMLLPEKPRQL